MKHYTQQPKLIKRILLFSLLFSIVLGGCDMVKTDSGKSNITIDVQSYYLEQDLFDIIYSTVNNSGTARSVGYYEALLSPGLDFSEYHLYTVSDSCSWYCFYCRNMFLFLAFNTDGVHDYHNSCLIDIFCTDAFYEFKDFASIQKGSGITDVKKIDNSITYKHDYLSSLFRTTKHICREGIVSIEWEKDHVMGVSFDENENVQELFNTISR